MRLGDWDVSCPSCRGTGWTITQEGVMWGMDVLVPCLAGCKMQMLPGQAKAFQHYVLLALLGHRLGKLLASRA